MHDKQKLPGEGWAKFPNTRPLQRPVKVIIDGVQKRGMGITTPRFPIEKYSGAAIEIEGQVFDSNNILWWKYCFGVIIKNEVLEGKRTY